MERATIRRVSERRSNYVEPETLFLEVESDKGDKFDLSDEDDVQDLLNLLGVTEVTVI